MAKTISAKFLVGSTLVAVGVKFTEFDFDSLSQARSALDVEYRVQGSTAWTLLSAMENPVTVRTAAHIYHNDWKFERNMWRCTVTGLTTSTQYDMRVRVGNYYSNTVQFTTASDPGQMSLSFSSSFDSYTELKSALSNFWSVLYNNSIRQCGMRNPGSMPINRGTGDPGSYVFSHLSWGDTFDGKDSATYLNDEAADTEGTTAVGRKCRNAFTFLHEMRHLFGCSPWTYSEAVRHRQGWQGRGTFNEIDSASSFVEVGNFIEANGYPSLAYFNDSHVTNVFDYTTNGSGTAMTLALKAKATATGKIDCQLAEVYQFMRGSDNVHPRMSGDHSNLADGPFFEGTSGTCVADIEMVFLLRALLFDKIEIKTTDGSATPASHIYLHNDNLPETLNVSYCTDLALRHTNEAFKLEMDWRPRNSGGQWSSASVAHYLFSCTTDTSNTVGTYAYIINNGSASNPVWVLVVNGHNVSLPNFEVPTSSYSCNYHIVYEFLSPTNISISIVGTYVDGGQTFMNVSSSDISLSSEAAALTDTTVVMYVNGRQATSYPSYGKMMNTSVLRYDFTPVRVCEYITDFINVYERHRNVYTQHLYDESNGLILYCKPGIVGDTLSFSVPNSPSSKFSFSQVAPNIVRLNLGNFFAGYASAFDLVVTSGLTGESVRVNFPESTSGSSSSGLVCSGYIEQNLIDSNYDSYPCTDRMQHFVSISNAAYNHTFRTNPYYRYSFIPYSLSADRQTAYYLDSSGELKPASCPYSTTKWYASSFYSETAWPSPPDLQGVYDADNAQVYDLTVSVPANNTGSPRLFFVNIGDSYSASAVLVIYQSA